MYAEVPGIPKDKLDVTITKDDIEISGKAEVERREEEKGYVVRERGYSQIDWRMAFPEARALSPHPFSSDVFKKRDGWYI